MGEAYLSQGLGNQAIMRNVVEVQLRGLVLSALLMIFARMAAAADPAAFPIWPKGPLGEKPLLESEKDISKPTDGLVAGRPILRITNVSVPTIQIFRPPKNRDTGAAVLVFPGGGYSIVVMDLEGAEVCEWLNSIGVTCVLLKYRVPRRPGRPMWEAPLEDAQRAMGLVRSQSGELGINPKRIGVLGFSAGGHLAAAISTNYDGRVYDPVDAHDAASCRPDFTLLIYPSYLTARDQGETISPELAITKETPPTFLIHAGDDKAENSLIYCSALRKAKVPAELHLYRVGSHGYGLRRTDKIVTTWPERAQEWMQSLGVLGGREK